MRPLSHQRLFIIAGLVWFFFLIAGLPDYYLQYSFSSMLWFVLLLLVPISMIMWLILKNIKQQRRLSIALWYAFYFTIPFMMYDYLYCGIYLGFGLNFVFIFWYLSVYYIIPWLLFPAVAFSINVIYPNRTQHG